jgi:succinate dehydrogenase/fumarate reductase flavoprotein subunit
MLAELRDNEARALQARNPHDLLRAQETLNVLTNAELVIQSCLARRASSRELMFARADYPRVDPPEWDRFVTVRREDGGVVSGSLPKGYWGDLQAEYEKLNEDYIATLPASTAGASA